MKCRLVKRRVPEPQQTMHQEAKYQVVKYSSEDDSSEDDASEDDSSEDDASEGGSAGGGASGASVIDPRFVGRLLKEHSGPRRGHCRKHVFSEAAGASSVEVSDDPTESF